MKSLGKALVLLLTIIPFAYCNATSIADIAANYSQHKISVDSLLNYINNPANANEVYWWSIHNSEKGDPMAIYISGKCFIAKIGTHQDNARAKQLFEQAYNKGVDDAIVDLGRIYLNGWGVDKDIEKGKQLLQQAASKNVARGFESLGWYYFDEEKDYPKALSSFRKAFDAGYIGSLVDVGYMYENGYGVEKDIAQAFNLYLKAADNGNGYGLYNVGIFYEKGLYVDQDHEKALRYYLTADTKGIAQAAYKIGYLKQYGDINQDIDYEDIAKWYEKSTKRDWIPAKVELAFLQLDGLGVPKNQEEAIATFEEVGSQNVSSHGALRIAECLLKNNPAKSLFWAKAAYDKADDYISTAESTKLLGLLYLKGGKEIYDYNLAVKHLREGAEMDQPECIELMKALGEPFEQQEPTISIRVK